MFRLAAEIKYLFRQNPKPKPKGGLQFRQNRNSAKMGEIRNTLVFRKEENEAEKYQKKFHACNYYIPNSILCRKREGVCR